MNMASIGITGNIEKPRLVHGNRIIAEIKRCNRAIAADRITYEAYQRRVQNVLRLEPRWDKRMHYENLALLPVSWA